jgi:hypothetical protein
MRRDIEFNEEGAVLRGWLYLPEHPIGRVPGVVMAHGFTAVKEMYLDRYAEVFAASSGAARDWFCSHLTPERCNP